MKNSLLYASLVALMIVVQLDARAAEESTGDLAAAAQNPIANMRSLPFQNNTSFDVGPGEGTINVLNIQPVIPLKLNEKWNLVTRTIVPVIYADSDVLNVEGLPDLPEGLGGGSEFGLGDVNFTGFFVPAKPAKVTWGVGPSINMPTATDDLLGTEQWSIGPSVVVLVTPKPWVIGGLVRQLWSVAGEDDRQDVNQTLIQPFINYNFKGGWYLSTAPIITANWEEDSDDRWTVPIGGGGGKIVKIGKRPTNISVQAFYNVEAPANGADWTLRLQLQLLFPK